MIGSKQVLRLLDQKGAGTLRMNHPEYLPVIDVKALLA